MTQPQPNLPRYGPNPGRGEIGLTYQSNVDRLRSALAGESDQRVHVILKLTSQLFDAARRLDTDGIKFTQQMIDDLNMREQVIAISNTFQPVYEDDTQQ